MRKHNFKNVTSNIVNALELPKDFIYGAVIITLTGNFEAIIENYRGIILYTTEKIRVQTKNCQIEILGTNLIVEYYTDDEMKITGIFHEINYIS